MMDADRHRTDPRGLEALLRSPRTWLELFLVVALLAFALAPSASRRLLASLWAALGSHVEAVAMAAALGWALVVTWLYGGRVHRWARRAAGAGLPALRERWRARHEGEKNEGDPQKQELGEARERRPLYRHGHLHGWKMFGAAGLMIAAGLSVEWYTLAATGGFGSLFGIALMGMGTTWLLIPAADTTMFYGIDVLAELEDGNTAVAIALLALFGPYTVFLYAVTVGAV